MTAFQSPDCNLKGLQSGSIVVCYNWCAKLVVSMVHGVH